MVGSWRPVRTPGMDRPPTASKLRKGGERDPSIWGSGGSEGSGLVCEMVPHCVFSLKISSVVSVPLVDIT